MDEWGGLRLAAREELLWFAAAARAPRLRTMRRFAEDEIVVPDGPHRGRRYRVEYQPYAGLWFDAVDSGLFAEHVATGPSQSGKTLTCSIIPVLYHLFEYRETVVFGIPDQDMAADKWNEDLLPVLEQTRYRDEIPSSGRGSRGGSKLLAIRFRNGATLRFMTGGGGDKSRAAFTSRVVVITETDGMDKRATGSEEADKIAQLEARTRAYGLYARIYKECTLTTKQGHTWRKYEAGTMSRISVRCVHCGERVSPERKDLAGWHDAQDEIAAEEMAYFRCPACEQGWSESDRVEMNRTAILLHRGQRVNRSGEIEGAPPRTHTLGFRWSAFHNMFVPPGLVAVMEYRAQRAEDPDNAERELEQFVWADPYEPPEEEFVTLSANGIQHRIAAGAPRGEVPDWCEILTLGADVAKRGSHWVLVAWGRDGDRCQVVDYGFAEFRADEIAPDRAMRIGLRDFRDETILAGWPRLGYRAEWEELTDILRRGDITEAERGRVSARLEEIRLLPSVAGIDEGWETATVREFCGESFSACRLFTVKGYGRSQRNQYRAPKSKHGEVRWIGRECYLAVERLGGFRVLHLNADHWKRYVQQRWGAGRDEPGAMLLPEARTPREHFSFAKHQVAERWVEKVERGHDVSGFERLHPNNHWLDAMGYAAMLAHTQGWQVGRPSGAARESIRAPGEKSRVSRTISRPEGAGVQGTRFTMPDGRAYLVTERGQ